MLCGQNCMIGTFNHLTFSFRICTVTYLHGPPRVVTFIKNGRILVWFQHYMYKTFWYDNFTIFYPLSFHDVTVSPHSSVLLVSPRTKMATTMQTIKSWALLEDMLIFTFWYIILKTLSGNKLTWNRYLGKDNSVLRLIRSEESYQINVFINTFWTNFINTSRLHLRIMY